MNFSDIEKIEHLYYNEHKATEGSVQQMNPTERSEVIDKVAMLTDEEFAEFILLVEQLLCLKYCSASEYQDHQQQEAC